MSLLRIEVLRKVGELAERAEAWDALVAEQAWGSPLALSSWFGAFLEHKLEAAGVWLVLLAYEGLVLRGVLPLVRSGLGALRRRRWRVPGEYFTRDGPPALCAGGASATLAALLKGLAQHERGSLGVEMGGLHADGAGGAPPAALEGRHAVLEPEGEGAFIPVRGTFDDWYAGISENLRVNLRKARNRLERERPGALAFTFRSGADATVAALEDFARLEDRGWKGEDGGALPRSPAKMTLYRSLVSAWAARGVLEWHVASLAGEPVAMHMAVRLGRTLTLMRICYDESIAKHMPGNLLVRAMVEREHATQACERIDFVQRQAWQGNWRMETYPYARALVPTPGLLPALGALPLRTKARLRRVAVLRALARRLRPA